MFNETVEIPLVGLIALIVVATSDLIDGIIARKFNQSSSLGAALDPFADKLMHVMTFLSLVIIRSVHWLFLVLVFIKEFLMMIGGGLILRYGKPIKANLTGKIASASLSLGLFISFFHPLFVVKGIYLDWIIIGLSIIIAYVAFFDYLNQAMPQFNVIFKSLKNDLDPHDVFERIEAMHKENKDVDVKALVLEMKTEKTSVN
jgi:phosphatidylglycerophosphate synthase